TGVVEALVPFVAVDGRHPFAQPELGVRLGNGGWASRAFSRRQLAGAALVEVVPSHQAPARQLALPSRRRRRPCEEAGGGVRRDSPVLGPDEEAGRRQAVRSVEPEVLP